MLKAHILKSQCPSTCTTQSRYILTFENVPPGKTRDLASTVAFTYQLLPSDTHSPPPSADDAGRDVRVTSFLARAPGVRDTPPPPPAPPSQGGAV